MSYIYYRRLAVTRSHITNLALNFCMAEHLWCTPTPTCNDLYISVWAHRLLVMLLMSAVLDVCNEALNAKDMRLVSMSCWIAILHMQRSKGTNTVSPYCCHVLMTDQLQSMCSSVSSTWCIPPLEVDVSAKELQELESKAPDDLLCPLGRVLMTDPVFTPSGFTYQRCDINNTKVIYDTPLCTA